MWENQHGDELCEVPRHAEIHRPPRTLTLTALIWPTLRRHVAGSCLKAFTPASNDDEADERCWRAFSAALPDPGTSGSLMKRYDAASEPPTRNWVICIRVMDFLRKRGNGIDTAVQA